MLPGLEQVASQGRAGPRGEWSPRNRMSNAVRVSEPEPLSASARSNVVLWRRGEQPKP